MAGDDQQALRQAEANAYLQNHKILELFNNMTSMLIYDRPADPKAYLTAQIQKLQHAKSTQLDFPSLFDESNIKSIFGMLDPTGKGYITLDQYKEALHTLGIQKYDKDPPGADMDRITMEKFVREAKLGLLQTSATFACK